MSADQDRGPATGRRRRSALAVVAGTYGTNVAVAALGLVNVLIVSRALAPTGRGNVVFLMTVTMLVSQLASVGVQRANGNIGAAEPRARPSLATNSVLLALLFGGLGIGLVSLLVELFPSVGAGADAPLRWLALASAPVLILSNYLWVLAQSDYRFGIANLVWLLVPVTNVVVNGVMAATDTISVASAIATWTGSQALALAILGWYVARRLSGFGRPDGPLARRSISFGLRTHAGQVGMLGNFRLDQWLLGSMAGAHALGLYSVAVAWAEVLFFLPTTLVIVQRPDLVRASPREAARQAAVAFRASLLITGGLGLAMVAAAPILCTWIFGEEFRGSGDDLRILALGALGIVAVKQLGNALTCRGRPMLETAAILLALAFTLVLDIVLIPRYEDVGASIASTVAYVAGGTAMVLLFARAVDTRLRDLLPRPSDLAWLLAKLRGAVRRGAPAPAES